MCRCRMRCGADCLVAVGLSILLWSGCGGSSDDGATSTGAGSDAVQPQAAAPPVAAISDTEAAPTAKMPSRLHVEPGSPEALLIEITELIAAANADVERQQKQDESSADPATETKDDRGSAATAAYQGRLQRIVELATQVIAATHLNPAKVQSFNNAVHYLSDARLELASMGDAAQAQMLIDDADSLYERDKSSFAASEAGYKVVELAERMARSFAGSDPDWLKEYAIQARRFAERFPDEPSRAAMGLFTAGRLCDRYNLVDEAKSCLDRVQSDFGDTVFGEQSAGILRRLALEGRLVELTGATIDGGFVDIDQYRGQVVLVVFWATTSPTFREQLPVIKRVESQHAGRGFSIIGVNLDADEAAVDQFLAEQEVSWPQVFAPDPAQRGGRNPVARYYGVQILPTYWLIGRNGIVVDLNVSLEDLSRRIAEMMNAS